MSEQSDHSLISFIATTVETMREQMATKDDIVRLESRMDAMREEMVTKQELRAELTRLNSRIDHLATKEELAKIKEQMATKDDLARLATTVKGDFEQVHLRFDTLGHVMDTRFGQVETDISRLRSVVYLLVKDQPDLLRLLGQQTPREIRP